MAQKNQIELKNSILQVTCTVRTSNYFLRLPSYSLATLPVIMTGSERMPGTWQFPVTITIGSVSPMRLFGTSPLIPREMYKGFSEVPPPGRRAVINT